MGCDYRLEESFNKKISLLALENCSNINFISYTFPHFVTRCEPEEPEDILYDGSILQDQRLYPLPALRDIYNDCDHSLVRFSTAHHVFLTHCLQCCCCDMWHSLIDAEECSK